MTGQVPASGLKRPRDRYAHRAMIVALNFPPDASVGTMRTLRLVRHLVEAGWDVDVITAAPERFRPGTVCDPALLEKVPDSARVARAKAWRPIERLGATFRPHSKAAKRGSDVVLASRPPRRSLIADGIRACRVCLALPDRDVSWVLPAVLAARRLGKRSRPDVVYSSGPPFTAHLVAAALARFWSLPWVADFRDPWARAPWRDDRFTFERQAWSLLERLVVTRADAVLFVTETNRREFARHYGDAIAARFHVVENGCDPSELHELARSQKAADSKFVLLHAGSLYGARNPVPLFKAVAALMSRGQIDRARFCLRFIGRVGIHGADLHALVRDLGLDDVVQFVSHMPRRAVLQEMLDASALLILQPVTTVSVPAKLYEYMAAGRPILGLVAPGGETDMVISRSRAGITVAAGEENAIGRALLEVMTLADRFGAVEPAYFDGTRRAAEIRAVLTRAADPSASPKTGVAATNRSTATEVIRR